MALKRSAIELAQRSAIPKVPGVTTAKGLGPGPAHWVSVDNKVPDTVAGPPVAEVERNTTRRASAGATASKVVLVMMWPGVASTLGTDGADSPVGSELSVQDVNPVAVRTAMHTPATEDLSSPRGDDEVPKESISPVYAGSCYS